MPAAIDNRIFLDEIYASFREALKQGVPIQALQAELDSAYRAHLFTTRKTLTDWYNPDGVVN